MKIKLAKKLMVGLSASLLVVSATAQVITSKGLSPPANTAGSFVDASIIRDSRIDQPLDLLNDFYPAIEVTISGHDNVRRRPGVQEDDLKIVATPSLGYRTNIGRHQFYAEYRGKFTIHDEYSQEDADANSLSAQLGLDLSHRWDLNAFAGISESFEERGVSGSRPFGDFLIGVDTGVDEYQYHRYGADLVYGRKVSPLNATLGYEKYSSRFKNNFQGDENLFGGRDRDTDSVHFDLSYEIGSKTSIFGRIQYSEIDYRRDLNSFDSEQTDYLFGLRWAPSNALSGAVGVGKTEKDFIDPSRADYDGSSYYVNVNYLISPFSSLGLSAARTVEEPGDLVSNYYVSDLLGVNFNHAISTRLNFNAYAKWIDDDYELDRHDEFFDFGLGLDYIWRPWLSAGIFYGEIERTSSFEGVDYDDRYYGIKLRSDLRTLLRGRGSRDESESYYRYPRPSEL